MPVCFADFNIARKSYNVKVYKTSSLRGDALGGATIGLYNEHGGLIAQDKTDSDGEILFKTNIVEGIILQEHVLYYMQEIRPPPGYELNPAKHWFYFCDRSDDNCDTCNQISGAEDAVRIPFNKYNVIPIINHLMRYELPSTGGCGIYPIILVSVMFIVTPLVYIFVLRCKPERRRSG